jgi:hypothetical protein
VNYDDYCQRVQLTYPRLHSHLYEWREDIFLPTVVDAVRSNTPVALRRVAEEVHPGVYAFDMLQPQFCRELLEEIEHFEDWRLTEGLKPLRPNSMNNYGNILDTFGFAPFLDSLMREYVAPFAALFYADVGGDSLDSHHGFVVEYQPDKDVKLDFHVDACEVTLNVCLGKEFTGGTLYFRGVRCSRCQETPWRPEELFEVAHHVGRAILHRGRHRHGANPIADGQRQNLILWCRSSKFARSYDESYCPDWCGGNGLKRTPGSPARSFLSRLMHPFRGRSRP